MKGVWSKEGASLFFLEASNRARESGFELCQGKFRLDPRKYFFTERVKHLNGLPRAAVESPPLKVFEQPVDMALRNMV